MEEKRRRAGWDKLEFLVEQQVHELQLDLRNFGDG